MKLILVLATALSGLAVSSAANAYTVSWKEVLREASAGNYGCYATACQEGAPVDSAVNCTNFSDVMFSYGKFTNDQANGYAWLTWNVDGPTELDWMHRREFTIDGHFTSSGFTNTGNFKTPKMGSNGRVEVKSMQVNFLPPVGALAHATIDLGGTAPMQLDLECCKDGLCDSEKPQTPSTGPERQPFQNPPRLCPSAPKAARDACLAEVAAGN